MYIKKFKAFINESLDAPLETGYLLLVGESIKDLENIQLKHYSNLDILKKDYPKAIEILHAESLKPLGYESTNILKSSCYIDLKKYRELYVINTEEEFFGHTINHKGNFRKIKPITNYEIHVSVFIVPNYKINNSKHFDLILINIGNFEQSIKTHEIVDFHGGKQIISKLVKIEKIN